MSVIGAGGREGRERRGGNVRYSQHLSRSLLQNSSLIRTHHSRWLMTSAVHNAISYLHLDRIHNYIKAHTRLYEHFFRSTSKSWFMFKPAVNYHPKTSSPFTALYPCVFHPIFAPLCLDFFLKFKYRTYI